MLTSPAGETVQTMPSRIMGRTPLAPLLTYSLRGTSAKQTTKVMDQHKVIRENRGGKASRTVQRKAWRVRTEPTLGHPWTILRENLDMSLRRFLSLVFLVLFSVPVKGQAVPSREPSST